MGLEMEIPNRKSLFYRVPHGSFFEGNANIVHFGSVLASHRPVRTLASEDVSSMDGGICLEAKCGHQRYCVCAMRVEPK